MNTKDISIVYVVSKPISINENSFNSNYDINMIRLYDKTLSEKEVISNYQYEQTITRSY